MRRGEIWWVAFDPALGSEIQKTRPAIIVSNDISNENVERLQVVPVTRNTRRIYPSDAIITFNQKENKAMANQIRTVSKMRVKSYIATLLPHEMRGVEQAIKIQLGLS